MQGFCILFSLIAREVGFTAPNLREQFKRKYGMTPTDIISASNDDPGYNLNADIVLKLHSQDGTQKYIQVIKGAASRRLHPLSVTNFPKKMLQGLGGLENYA